MNHTFRSVLALLAIVCASTGAHAQRVADLRPSFRSEIPATVAADAAVLAPSGFDVAQEAGAEPTLGQVILGGSLGALAGFFGGAYLGYHAERNGGWDCACDDPGLEGLLYGAAIGSSIAVPTGAHLSNGRRGDLVQGLAVSSLIGALGIAGLHGGLGNDAGLLLIFGPPLAQVAAAVTIERRTGRQRE